MALKCADALAAGRMIGEEAAARGQLPHLDGLVKTATNQAVARRRKGNRVDTILVAMLALKAHNQLLGPDIPHADAFVKRSGSDIQIIRRDGYSRHAILNGEVGDLLVRLELPQTHAAVTTAGCNELAVPGEIERVNVLLVSGELMLDLARGNVPHLVRSSALSHGARKSVYLLG